MRQIRFAAIALVSFVAAIVSSFIDPGTFFHRTLSVALCSVLGFTSNLCYANLARNSGERAVAAVPPTEQTQNTAPALDFSPYLQSTRLEFDKPDLPYPQGTGSNINQPGVDKPNDRSQAAQYIRNEFKAPIYTFYVNGIKTEYGGYVNDVTTISTQLLTGIVDPARIYTPTYNPTGFSKGKGDLLESAFQANLSADFPGGLRTEIFHNDSLPFIGDKIKQAIKQIDKDREEEAKQKCESSPRAKFLLIGHSQGNFFIQDIAEQLDKEFADRTVLFSIAPFTNFGLTTGKVRGFSYLLRSDDFPAFLDGYRLGNIIPTGIRIPAGGANLPPLPTLTTYQGEPTSDNPQDPKKVYETKNGKLKWGQMLDSHSLKNYLGEATHPEYADSARRALEMARTNLGALLNFDSGKYEKKNEDCSPKNPETASSWGDPHLVTFDRLKYDHHAVGEFILAKSTDGNFEIQVREAAVPASSQVALNTAAAMKVGNTRVAFYVKDFPDSDTTNPLRVDGKPTVIQGGSLSLPGGGTITQVNQGSYIVEWPTGERVGVKVDNFGSSALLDINPALPQTRQGQLIGLLGNFNGNPDDDLKSRDGKVLPPQSTINQVSQITQNLTNWVPIPLNQVESLFLEQLHKQFGDSWRISQQESLFDYAPGKNTESYTNRAFPNGFQVLRMLLPAQVQAAETACQKAGVPAERLEGCLFDVGVTGNADFAKVAANALTNIVRDRVEQQIRDRIPVPGGIKIPGIRF